MFVLIGKMLLPLIQPLGLATSCWGAAVVLALWRRRAGARALALAGMALVTFFSLPPVGERLLGQLEDDFPALAPAACPPADAIIVLGGMTAAPLQDGDPVDVNGAFDRLLHGVRLLRAGKAPVMVLTGGNITALTGSNITEAERLRALAVEYGVAPQALILEQQSRNTHENAVYVAPLLRQHGCRVALLVTSASHMRRAVAAFSAQNVDVIPAPTDVRVVPRPFTAGRLVPSVDALEYSSRAFKEYLGLWVYRLRGWG